MYFVPISYYSFVCVTLISQKLMPWVKIFLSIYITASSKAIVHNLFVISGIISMDEKKIHVSNI